MTSSTRSSPPFPLDLESFGCTLASVKFTDESLSAFPDVLTAKILAKMRAVIAGHIASQLTHQHEQVFDEFRRARDHRATSVFYVADWSPWTIKLGLTGNLDHRRRTLQTYSSQLVTFMGEITNTPKEIARLEHTWKFLLRKWGFWRRGGTEVFDFSPLEDPFYGQASKDEFVSTILDFTENRPDQVTDQLRFAAVFGRDDTPSPANRKALTRLEEQVQSMKRERDIEEQEKIERVSKAAKRVHGEIEHKRNCAPGDLVTEMARDVVRQAQLAKENEVHPEWCTLEKLIRKEVASKSGKANVCRQSKLKKCLLTLKCVKRGGDLCSVVKVTNRNRKSLFCRKEQLQGVSGRHLQLQQEAVLRRPPDGRVWPVVQHRHGRVCL